MRSLGPSVGLVQDSGCSLYVVGTAHTPSSSQQRHLTTLINKVNPDVVLLELDAERAEMLDRLGDSPAYGAELAAAAAAARSVDACIVLGDTRKPVRSLFTAAPFVDARRLVRAARLALRPAPDTMRGVNIPRSLVDDPAKLTPLLAAAVSVAAGVAAVSSAGDATLVDPSWSGSAVLMAESAALLRVVDSLLVARDEVLSRSALRALEIGSRLRSGEVARRKWTFPTDADAVRAVRGAGRQAGAIPLFTLRRPLEEDEVRVLNLFEPRYLALMDELAETNGGALQDAAFGVLHALNRYYREDSSGTVREADVVVCTAGRRARVLRSLEGVRPVTGARKLTVWVKGEEELEVLAESVVADPAGFLVGKPASDLEWCSPDDDGADSKPSSTTDVRVVCVVGLAHANGVLARCAEVGLGREVNAVTLRN